MLKIEDKHNYYWRIIYYLVHNTRDSPKRFDLDRPEVAPDRNSRHIYISKKAGDIPSCVQLVCQSHIPG